MTTGRLFCNHKEVMENCIVFEQRVVLLDQIGINLFAIVDSYND